MKLILHPSFEYLRSFIENIPLIFDNEGEMIYEVRNRIKTFRVAGKELVVKSFRKPIFINRIIYTCFRPSKAVRSFEHALKLLEKGFGTPAPVACIEQKAFGLMTESYYISEKSTCPYHFHDAFKSGFEHRDLVVTSYAEFVGEMHEKQTLHNDLSRGNILFDIKDRTISFQLLDVNRMYFGKVGLKRGCRDFKRTIGDDETLATIASHYAARRGFDAAECSRLIIAERNRFFAKKSIDKATGDKIYKRKQDIRPMTVGVIISTYNNPQWLEKVLWGYQFQSHQADEIIIADDGSGEDTARLIEKYRYTLPIKHVWHEDHGFRKTKILNKAILASQAEYLIFTDHDCIPRNDFIQVHIQNARQGYMLSGGYFKLPMSISHGIDRHAIVSRQIFRLSELKKRGLKSSWKNTKLVHSALFSSVMNIITPTKATWNGCNASAWRKDIIAVNGFNENMRYGGEDREFGERLLNYGIQSKQIRYSAIALHLDHNRPYVDPVEIKKNNETRKHTRKNRIIGTPFGIRKEEKDGHA